MYDLPMAVKKLSKFSWDSNSYLPSNVLTLCVVAVSNLGEVTLVFGVLDNEFIKEKINELT